MEYQEKMEWIAMVNRHAGETAETVLGALTVTPGMTVADVGAGGGWYTFEFSRLVGSSGQVFALEVDEDFIRELEKEIERRAVTNVETVLVQEDGDGLAIPECDLLFIRNVLHHMEQPEVFLSALRPHLKPGGNFVVIDWLPGAPGPHGPRQGLKQDELVVLLERAGFRHLRQLAILEEQSLNIFTA